MTVGSGRVGAKRSAVRFVTYPAALTMSLPTHSLSLSVDHLTVRYGRRTALHSVSFEAGTGSTALLGRNGAGKSSLVRCLATTLEPASGTVTFNRIPAVGRSTRQYRRLLGYVPQNPGTYASWRVRAFVEHMAALKDLPWRSTRSEADRVLDLVDLSEERRRRISSLSGGMRQRLALACSLLGSPRLLVLDEPTTGLDPEQRMRFRQVIGTAADSACVILSTHLTEEVTAFCDRVLVLDKGRIRFDGSPQELTAQAAGYVWTSPEHSPGTWASWKVPGGMRHLGPRVPVDGLAQNPTIDDGYLTVIRQGGQS